MKRIYLSFFLMLFLYACSDQTTNDKAHGLKTDHLTQEQSIQHGQQLFSSNCKVCHSLNPEVPTGMAPVLQNIKIHWPDKNVLNRYIKNAPSAMQESERSRKIYQKWKGKAQMPPFVGLTEKDINHIILFLYTHT